MRKWLSVLSAGFHVAFLPNVVGRFVVFKIFESEAPMNVAARAIMIRSMG